MFFQTSLLSWQPSAWQKEMLIALTARAIQKSLVKNYPPSSKRENSCKEGTRSIGKKFSLSWLPPAYQTIAFSLSWLPSANQNRTMCCFNCHQPIRKDFLVVMTTVIQPKITLLFSLLSSTNQTITFLLSWQPSANQNRSCPYCYQPIKEDFFVVLTTISQPTGTLVLNWLLSTNQRKGLYIVALTTKKTENTSLSVKLPLPVKRGLFALRGNLAEALLRD